MFNRNIPKNYFSLPLLALPSLRSYPFLALLPILPLLLKFAKIFRVITKFLLDPYHNPYAQKFSNY